MIRIILFAIGIIFCLKTYSQNNKKDYQDPAFWIDLKTNKNDVTVQLVSEDGAITVLNAPLKFIARKDPNLKPLEISIDSIKYEAESKTRQVVYLDGAVDLNCCRNKPINMEFYDLEDNLIQFSRTDEQGKFKLKSVNGKILEIRNNKIKVNFKKLKTIDENWDERYATLERKSFLENTPIDDSNTNTN